MQAIYLKKPVAAGDKVPNVFTKSLAEFRRERWYPSWGELEYAPPTGLGRFWVRYDAQQMELRVILPIYFHYEPYAQLVDLDTGDVYNGHYVPRRAPEMLPRAWPEEERNRFQQTIASDIERVWSHKFAFRCATPGWTDQLARVVVSVEAVEENDPRVPWFATCRHADPSDGPDRDRDNVTGRGVLFYASRVLDPNDPQRVAAHEAGHMFGLGDEYVEQAVDGRRTGASPAHAYLVASERYLSERLPEMRPYGSYAGVADPVVSNDARIMSNGNEVRPEHYVTFLHALRAATVADIPVNWVLDPNVSP